MPKLAVIVVAALCLVPIGACGGGGSSLTKAEFIKQGDAICGGLTKQTDKLDTPTTNDEVAAYLQKALVLAKSARADFAGLKAPDDGKKVQDALLESLDESLATAEKAIAAAGDGDFDKMGKLLDAASTAGDKADAAAKKYGFDDCGTNSSTGG